MNKSPHLKRLLILLFCAIIVSANVYWRPLLQQLPEWLAHYPVASKWMFAAIYIVGTILFFPGLVLTLMSGFMFGPVLGGLIALTSATIGATAAFMIARYLSASWVRQQSYQLLTKVIEGVNREGWRFVAFARLVPLFPFNMVNYAFGLTSIPWWQFSITSYVCMAPAAIAYSYLGSLGHAALQGDVAILIKKGLLGLALIAGLIFITRVVTYSRAAKK